MVRTLGGVHQTRRRRIRSSAVALSFRKLLHMYLNNYVCVYKPSVCVCSLSRVNVFQWNM